MGRKASNTSKYEWTLKVLEECGEIESRDDVEDIDIVFGEGFEIYYKLVMKDGGVKQFTMSEINEIISRYIVNTSNRSYIEFVRASGMAICEDCKKLFKEHPMAEDLDNNGKPYLNKLCNGQLVKL